MNKVYLLLGSNLGNRIETLASVRKVLEIRVGKILSKSSCYETEPWGKTDQPEFINQVLLIETPLKPQEVLKTILQIELEHGRIRKEKFGARVIDIDILYYENEIIVTEELKIPHPEIHNRRFVLVPLVEIAAEFKHPVFNLSNNELLTRCKDNLKVYPANQEATT
ncbi:MAG TPA: 2-amino-4-hydroxy-6-hydroxymethyldihydropteridine diphosphokinase [Cytophagaceae bacterium]